MAFFAFLFALLPLVGHGAPAWDVEKMMEVQKVDGVLPSPDGTRVLYVTSKVCVDGQLERQESRWLSQIHLCKSDGTATMLLTHRPFSCSQATFSPDGKSVAFVSSEGGKNELWHISLAGGDAEKLTHVQGSIFSFRFSPDGKSIAVLMTDLDAKSSDIVVVDENVKMNRLYLLTLTKNEKGDYPLTPLTDTTFSVGTGVWESQFDWSPDGREIVFPRMPTSQLNEAVKTELCVVDVTTKKVRELVTGSFAIAPYYSPNGEKIAFVSANYPVRWEMITEISVIDSCGGTPKQLAATFNSDVAWSGGLLGWSSDGKSVFYYEAYKSGTKISSLPIDGREPQPINFGALMIEHPALNASGSCFGFTAESSACPQEGFVKKVSSTTLTQITHLNDNLPLDAVAKTKIIEWKSKDGTLIEGLLTYPLHYAPGNRYPLLVVVHGGPAYYFQDAFIGNPSVYPLATFAAEGYAILRANIRGSTGYGKEFRLKNYRDWGGQDFVDLMSGIDFLIEQGVADKDRLAIMGWSYGGYMTAWTITQTHRFKAASVGAGISDLISMAGTCDVPAFLTCYFGGPSWDELALYLERSAIAHIKGVTTPTLIQHGSDDARVPPSQAYELYHALKEQCVPSQLVIYPRSGHNISEPKLLLDAAERNLSWFNKYLAPPSCS